MEYEIQAYIILKTFEDSKCLYKMTMISVYLSVSNIASAPVSEPFIFNIPVKTISTIRILLALTRLS